MPDATTQTPNPCEVDKCECDAPCTVDYCVYESDDEEQEYREPTEFVPFTHKGKQYYKGDNGACIWVFDDDLNEIGIYNTDDDIELYEEYEDEEELVFEADICCGCGKGKDTGGMCDCGGAHRELCEECLILTNQHSK